MKKFILVLLLLQFFGCANAFSLNLKEQPKFVQDEQFLDITNEANAFYAQNDIKKAQELFLTIPEEKRSPQNWLLLGNIMQDNGKLQEAEFMYKKAIELDDSYYKAHYNLANIYVETNKPNLAIEEYKKVIKIKSDYPYAHYNLACVYISQEKYSKAKYELYTAIDLKNTVADFHYNLAYVFKKLGKEKDANKYLEHYKSLME